MDRTRSSRIDSLRLEYSRIEDIHVQLRKHRSLFPALAQSALWSWPSFSIRTTPFSTWDSETNEVGYVASSREVRATAYGSTH